jgi:hypothetical protein
MSLLNVFRLVDETIRPGNSPSDLLMKAEQVVAIAGDNTISVPFKEGTEVAYMVLPTTTVNVDGQITAVSSFAGDAVVLAFAKSMNLTVGGSSF